MLKKSKISGIKILSDEWKTARLAKFTSSDMYRGFGYETGITYVREKVGEELTGKSAKGEIDTDATRWGGFYEAEALMKFGQKSGLDFLVTQQLVCDSVSRFGCTPDGLIVIRESPDKTEYEVETVEVKCPPTYPNYIELFECENPQDLKRANRNYYWQCLDQMDNCESLIGHFVVYHPDFKRGNMKVIRIEKNQPLIDAKGKKTFPVNEDMKALRQQKIWLEEKFHEVRTKLMMVENV